MTLSDFLIPFIITGIFVYSLYKKVDIFKDFTAGAKENILISFEILPTLILLMLTVGMLRSSGALEAFCDLISPFLDAIGIPTECVPLAIMRPVSGSGALSILEGILSEHSPDSFVGRVASVLMGSTETTFYTIAVYFGATKIKNTRHALPSALAGDITAFLISSLAVRLFFSPL